LLVRWVGLFVRDDRCNLSFLDIHEIWQRYAASVPYFTVSFSEFKVKIQGQNRRREKKLPLVKARSWFIYSLCSSKNIDSRKKQNNNKQILSITSLLLFIRCSVL